MNTKLLFAAAALAATGIASSASAQVTAGIASPSVAQIPPMTTITFGALTLGTFTSATFGEYVISNAQSKYGGQDAVVFTSDQGVTAIGDDQTNYFADSHLTIARVDGKAFDVYAMTFAIRSGSGGPSPYSYVQTDPGGKNGWFQTVSTDQQSYGGAAITGVTSLHFDIFAQEIDFVNHLDAAGISSITVSSIPAVTAVPEPATWAMMIAGFGLVGAAMRRHRAKTALRYT